MNDLYVVKHVCTHVASNDGSQYRAVSAMDEPDDLQSLITAARWRADI